jgi:hypothetical protein
MNTHVTDLYEHGKFDKQKWTSNHIWFTCSNCGIVGDFNLNLDKFEHCCVENKMHVANKE